MSDRKPLQPGDVARQPALDLSRQGSKAVKKRSKTGPASSVGKA